jgi:hypothetical protein
LLGASEIIRRGSFSIFTVLPRSSTTVRGKEGSSSGSGSACSGGFSWLGSGCDGVGSVGGGSPAQAAEQIKPNIATRLRKMKIHRFIYDLLFYSKVIKIPPAPGNRGD